jgi:hypothetical protein
VVDTDEEVVAAIMVDDADGRVEENAAEALRSLAMDLDEGAWEVEKEAAEEETEEEA